ncbi:tRNA (guanine37-N1)-methyltransferase [Natronocella acetinitrilica]|jgi:tRNA (guanine37-N1)-methyltransferase|uniref:tRNA (guanine-N(1)-)-methyltransferase n=1 Tax=Natronocella acetinitrilica TaxID=414046 RepID=A0AAE3G814_9GAMM|nr:tRNA (guanosine(37)-N1)-methyltransferase TrmD [Natronocella acetinitrilica]MCP1676724.1 tRNA (guanine37-N1)-methyltransferase [Natronocella acetinitrilica]
MRIDAVTLFPDLVSQVTQWGVTGRASEQGLLQLVCWNPRDYARDRHRTVDDRPYGGGPGMVMKVEPLRAAMHEARASAPGRSLSLYLSPQGRRLDQAAVERLAGQERLLLVCGRYEGIDERVIATEIDEEISIGDYVLSGGELPAMVLIDAVARLIPGALGHADSASEDSFSAGLLDYPHYTRPEVLDGMAVPAVLLSGDHDAIGRWRRQQALGRSWLRRPDLINRAQLSTEDRRLLDEYIDEYRSARADSAKTGQRLKS